MNRTTIDVLGVGQLKFATHNDHDPYISGCIERGKVFEPHILTVLRGLLRPGDRFLDVGGNIGWFATIASKLVGKSGKVYAIEPDPDNFELLRLNLDINNCVNSVAWNRAAGAVKQTVELGLSRDNRGDHRVFADNPNDRPSVRVKQETVDQMLWWRSRIDVALLDTQGSEVKVLRGMRKTLKRNPNLRLIFEYWPEGLVSCGSSTRELAHITQEQGWLLWLVNEDGTASRITAQQIERMSVDDGQRSHTDIVGVAPCDSIAVKFLDSLC